MELGNYLETYLKYVDPLYTMLGQWDRGSRLVHLVQPRTPAQFIIKYMACAIIARMMGQRDRSKGLLAEAKGLANRAFDELSADGLVGFMLLGSFCTGGDIRINYHYYNVALSMFNLLKPSEVPPNIRHFMTVCSVLGSEAMNGPAKITLYMNKSLAIENQNYSHVLIGAIMRLRVKVFCHIKCCESEKMRVDIVATLSCRVIYSEAQRTNLLAELKTCKQIASMCHDINADKHLSTSVKILLQIFEIIVEWRSGHVEIALPLAIEFANEITLETIRFGGPFRHRFDVEQLLMVCIFLYEQQQPTLSNKLQKIAESYANLVYDSFPLFDSSTTDSVVAYIRAEPLAPLYPSSTPSSSSSSNPMMDDMMPTMVGNIITLISQLVPMNSQKSLLPAQGLHMFYKTLSTFLPPSLAPFDSESDKPFTPTVVSSAPLLSFPEEQNNNNNNNNNINNNNNNTNSNNNNNNNVNCNHNICSNDIHSSHSSSPPPSVALSFTTYPNSSNSLSSSPSSSPSSSTLSSSFTVAYNPPEIYAYPEAVTAVQSHPFHFLQKSPSDNNAYNWPSYPTSTPSSPSSSSSSPSPPPSFSPSSSPPIVSILTSPINETHLFQDDNYNKTKAEASFIPIIDDPIRLTIIVSL